MVRIYIFIIIFFSGCSFNKNSKFWTSETIKKIEEQKLSSGSKGGNTFYNVKYSGLDLKGNRFSIISNEGTTSDLNSTQM